MAAAWLAIMVDPDHIQSLADSMHEPDLGAIVALQVAHPNNPDLLRLKQHAALKNASCQSWKDLCLPSRGGGSDRLQVFVSERSEAGSGVLVKAVARAIRTLYLLLEKCFTVSQDVKLNGPTKAESAARLDAIDLPIDQGVQTSHY